MTLDMSNTQPPATGERGRPTSRQEHPYFRRIRSLAYSTHEQAVLDAGYPWVRTNPLIPTGQSAGVNGGPNCDPDQLPWHGHHGVNTHLIVEGDLTIMKLKKMFGQNHISVVTLSTNPNRQKELSVAPDEVYAGTAEQDCKFVEGHRSLSPVSAHRFVSRGSLEWVGEDGQVARGDEKTYILEQLNNADFETKFDFRVMRRVASCTFKDDNQTTRNLRQWFLREWNDPDVQDAKGDLLAAIHPLEAHLVPRQRDQEEGGFDDDELDLDDKHSSFGFIRAVKQWLLGGNMDK